ncbi:MAG: protein kinase domain-containing protein [Solirubrobacteraceae bacterium]
MGDNYTIERELGGGGMSRVFVAEETSLGRKVVVKVLPPDLAVTVNVERFRREIQLAAKLQHPLIVPVLAAGISEGLPYYTMPFIEGESLRTRLARSGELPVNEAARILRDVLSALAYAHEHGVVHRDIKPDNVLLTGNHAVVADFGVAKALSASTNPGSSLTSLGVALGTPAYMSPEQAAADPATDHRADLYAVGAMAYEMLTGHQVFSARSPQAMLAAHAVEKPEPIDKRRPSVPTALSSLVMRSLEKHAADRPQSAGEMLADLEAAVTPSGATPPTRFTSSMRSKRWPKPLIIGGAAETLALLAGGALAWQRSRQTLVAGTAAPRSIAVLPFANMSGDPQNDYLGDGLSEELIGGLSQVRGLQVAARSSSFAFKGKNEDVRSIGATLGVGSVLNGSVRKAGNKLRVSVQLTNVSSGYNLWSDTYDREMRDVFAVEDEISHAIVDALAVRLGGTQAKGQIVEQSTTDPEAYDLYLKGRYAWNQRGTHLLEAEQFFKRAIARDSSFALAWSGLSDVYGIMTSWGYMTPRQAAAEAPRYAERAVSLAPTLPEPHISLGNARCHLTGRYEEGLAEFRRAIELNPSLGVAHYFYSLCLDVSGRPREALAEGLEAQRLEPLNVLFSAAPVWAYLDLGNPDSAIAIAQRATKLAPALGSPYQTMVFAYALKGDTARVRWAVGEAVKRNAGYRVPFNAFLDILANDSAAFASLRPQPMKNVDQSAIYVAMGYAFNRNADSTLAWLDRAYALKSDEAGMVHLSLFDWLRNDPRFVAFRKKYNIPELKG